MNISEITAKAEALGYTIHINEDKVEYIWPADRTSYIPELYRSSGWKDDLGAFEIQTVSYGSKSLEEIEGIIAGLKAGVEMVKAITEFEEANNQ